MGAVANQFERFPAFARQLRLIEENACAIPTVSARASGGRIRSSEPGPARSGYTSVVRRFEKSPEPSGWKAGARGRGRRICELH